ncbi:MAG: hypothetical protein KGI60_01560 [Patescibacteria group bacterium]|nr:hypothetical protein [Patescibacteria group bacterium]
MTKPKPELPDEKEWVTTQDSDPYVFGVEKKYFREVADPLNPRRKIPLRLFIFYAYDAGKVGMRWDVCEVHGSETKVVHYEAILLNGKTQEWFIGEPGMQWRFTMDKLRGKPVIGIFLSLGSGEHFRRIYVTDRGNRS